MAANEIAQQIAYHAHPVWAWVVCYCFTVGAVYLAVGILLARGSKLQQQAKADEAEASKTRAQASLKQELLEQELLARQRWNEAPRVK